LYTPGLSLVFSGLQPAPKSRKQNSHKWCYAILTPSGPLLLNPGGSPNYEPESGPYCEEAGRKSVIVMISDSCPCHDYGGRGGHGPRRTILAYLPKCAVVCLWKDHSSYPSCLRDRVCSYHTSQCTRTHSLHYPACPGHSCPVYVCS
jgi:hypothetical protein